MTTAIWSQLAVYCNCIPACSMLTYLNCLVDLIQQKYAIHFRNSFYGIAASLMKRRLPGCIFNRRDASDISCLYLLRKWRSLIATFGRHAGNYKSFLAFCALIKYINAVPTFHTLMHQLGQRVHWNCQVTQLKN